MKRNPFLLAKLRQSAETEKTLRVTGTTEANMKFKIHGLQTAMKDTVCLRSEQQSQTRKSSAAQPRIIYPVQLLFIVHHILISSRQLFIFRFLANSYAIKKLRDSTARV